MRVARVLETCLYADDLAAGEKFYSEILGLQVFSRSEGRHLFFSCGEGVFLLFRAAETERPASGVPPHGARGPGHVAFAVLEREIAGWRRHLGESGVAIEAEISW
ncbi:MAG: VOC family protein, partial [Acidobacteria bacterium]|nr:VOC family protein [Acidobacteriota bacterium]